MVRQLNGEYKVKDESIRKQYRRIQKMLEDLPLQFEIRHIPRERNREADQLANRGIDSKKRVEVR
jgi:ribonuclease HI